MTESPDEEGFLGFPQKFWDVWTDHKKKDTEFFKDILKPNFSALMAIAGGMRNKCLNYPIQGTAADMTKVAATNFLDWVDIMGFKNKILIPNIVHDEIVVECPEDLAEVTADRLIKEMQRAGSKFSDIKMTADYKISKKWDH